MQDDYPIVGFLYVVNGSIRMVKTVDSDYVYLHPLFRPKQIDRHPYKSFMHEATLMPHLEGYTSVKEYISSFKDGDRVICVHNSSSRGFFYKVGDVLTYANLPREETKSHQIHMGGRRGLFTAVCFAKYENIPEVQEGTIYSFRGKVLVVRGLIGRSAICYTVLYDGAVCNHVRTRLCKVDKSISILNLRTGGKLLGRVEDFKELESNLSFIGPPLPLKESDLLYNHKKVPTVGADQTNQQGVEMKTMPTTKFYCVAQENAHSSRRYFDGEGDPVEAKKEAFSFAEETVRRTGGSVAVMESIAIVRPKSNIETITL